MTRAIESDEPARKREYVFHACVCVSRMLTHSHDNSRLTSRVHHDGTFRDLISM